MEFVLRVNLDFGYRRILGGIEGRQLRFRRVEFPEVAAGICQAEVVGVGWPVAPGLLVGLGGSGNGGLPAALIAFELGQHVECIGVNERVRPALGGAPDLIEALACGVIVLLPPVQFGQGCQRGKFFFN